MKKKKKKKNLHQFWSQTYKEPHTRANNYRLSLLFPCFVKFHSKSLFLKKKKKKDKSQ